MAPLSQRDIDSMMRCLKAPPLLGGYRGSDPINFEKLKKLLLTFSDLVVDLENFVESIDPNPVICSLTRSAIADARMMLKKS